MIFKGAFVDNHRALEELVEDAKRAGLVIERHKRYRDRYIIEGILVYKTPLYTVGFEKVRKLIKARFSDE